MKTFWPWLGAWGTVVLASGCLSSYSCPSQACDDGFAANLELSSATATWEDGTYVFDVDAGSETASCTLSMPVAADEVATCTTEQIGVLITGNAPTKIVLLGTTPSTVTVTVSRDGTELVSKTFSPTYTPFQSCGMTCQQAVETVTIP